jgi:signal transduction histidine kinase
VTPVSGARVGRWTLRRLLGTGGFGSTWEVEDEVGRLAALKLLERAPGRELLALERLVHPAIPQLVAVGESPHHVVMERIPGRDLAFLLRAGAAPRPTALRVVANIAEALAVVHHSGLVHGDVKPGNIVVSLRGPRVALVDFGSTGGSGGTLLYAPPERLAGAQAQAAGDVYSLGLVLWELLAGALPWGDLGESLTARRGPTPQPDFGEPWLDELVVDVLASDPGRRPEAAQVADVLAAHGHRAQQGGAAVLRRRARAVHVALPEIQPLLEAWVREGGTLNLLGPAGSGRGHALRRCEVALLALGKRPVWLSELRGGALSERLLGDHDALLVEDLEALEEPDLALLQAAAEAGRLPILTRSTRRALPGTQLSLPRLASGPTRALICGVLGSDQVPDALVEALSRRARGLPGVVVEGLLRAAEEGLLRRRALRWFVDQPGLIRLLAEADLDQPELGELEGLQARVGALVASAGDPLCLEELRSFGLHELQLLEALDGLERRGLLIRRGGGLIPSGPEVARGLVAASGQAAPLHLLHLARLRRAGSERLDQQLRHALLGGDLESAEALASEGLRQAARRAPLAAAPLAELALEWLPPEPGVLAAAATCLRSAGHLERVLELAEQARAEARWVPLLEVAAATALEADDAPAVRRLLERADSALGEQPRSLELELVRANLHFRSGELDRALAVVEGLPEQPPADHLAPWLRLRGVQAEALMQAGRGETALEVLDLPEELGRGSSERALLYGILGRLHWHAGRFLDASRAMERAATESEGLDRIRRARLLNNAGAAAYRAGFPSLALQRWEEALAEFELLGNQLEQIRLNVNLCLGYRDACRWQRAREAGELAWGLATRRGEQAYRAMAAGNLGELAVAQGRWANAASWYRIVAELAEAHQLEGELVELARRRAELSVRRDQPTAHLDALQALRVAEEAGDELECLRCRALLGVCCARRGDRARATDLLEASRARLRELGAASEIAQVRIWHALASLALGEHEHALEQVERVRSYASEVGHAWLAEQARQVGVSSPEEGLDERRVDRLLELTTALVSEQDLGEVLAAIARASLELIHGDRAFVLLEDGLGELQIAATHSLPGAPSGQPSMSIAQRAWKEGREVVAADIEERGDLRAARSVASLHLRSAVCVPLSHAGDLLGAVYVDSQMRSEVQLEQRLRYLRALAGHAAVAIRNARRLRDLEHMAMLSAGLVHDIRSPVGTILMLAEDLEARHPELAHPLGDIQTVGRSVLERADALLELRGQGTSELDLSELAARVAQGSAVQARVAGVGIELRAEPGLVVVGSASSLSTLLDNLLSNALRFSPRGGRVTLSLRGDEDSVHLGVEDEGPGIPEELLARVFEDGVSSRGPGHGLGLSMVKRITQAHGGRLLAENRDEGGARFVVSLLRLKGTLPQPASR